ncbi:hypothetical protein PVAND_009402 [Polypedilum vanderplanki]|uniref:Major facilitator superfamily (MFS) profile domain-containing protein n=1 Tax=Polypedilum vanderplanki TaxID=319348 RepID=A0A9J6CCH2_POLVA|nr:hypothetical protein PVAND_009402 [Polypedilum vanderplanki]
MEDKGSAWSQIYTAICINLLTFSYGTSVGWLSTVVEDLKNDATTPLQNGALSMSEIAIIGGTSCIGGFISSCIYGWLADRYGRKLTLISLGVPQVIGWLLVYFAKNSYYLIISRFLHGFAGGGTYIVVPLFVTEISQNHIRGRLGSILILFCNFGILAVYILGAFVNYHITSICLLMVTNVFFAGIVVIHDSPIYLLKKSKFKQAEQALKFYRGYGNNQKPMNDKVKDEYDSMITLIKIANCDSNDGKITRKDFLTKAAIKSIFIGMALMIFELFTGAYALLSYASMIFEEAGSTLSPNISAIIIGLIQVVGVYFSTFLVDRAGRRFLMITSGICCTLGLAIFSIYDFAKVNDMNVTDFKWIPLFSFSFVIFSANFGLISIPFLILTEIAPIKIKSIVYTFNLSFSWIVAFMTVMYLPTSIIALGVYGTMSIFALSCLTAAIFVYLFVPETKNKSIEEIQKIMSS